MHTYAMLYQMILFQRKYFRYLHRTTAIVFAIVCIIKQARFDLSSTIFAKFIFLAVLFASSVYQLKIK